MTDTPDDGERPVASWLSEQLDEPSAPPPHAPPPLAPQPADPLPVASWLLPPPPVVAVEPPPELIPPVAVGAGTRLGCAVLELVLFVCCLAVGWVIWWVATWPRGGTPARAILHLAAVRDDGSGVPSFLRVAAREIPAKLLLPLAPVSALVWLAGRRGLWDRLTRTTVVVAA